MLVNPLFNQDEEDQEPAKKEHGPALHHRKGRTIQPISKDLKASSYNPVQNAKEAPKPPAVKGQASAVELIRQKVAAFYTEEPDVEEEMKEVAKPTTVISKHQQFMQELSTSGKSLAEIQVAWHNYYVNLPDGEKHEVWQEFYQNNARNPSSYTTFVTGQKAEQDKSEEPKAPGLQLGTPNAPKAVVGEHLPTPDYEARKRRRHTKPNASRTALKKQILDKVNVSAETQEKAKDHIKSLVFGLGTGALVLIIFLFSFFNEMVIAPFIQPSRHVSATPIIMSTDSVAASETPEVIIPKINVQIPTIFDEKKTDEASVQSALERGVTHYPTTSLPGQQGNTAFFGHSSNNLFNKGKYKFAFVLLHQLVPGDIFYLTYDKKVYAYKVYDKKVVPPTEVSVLNNVPGKTATATLITCDPPGTDTNRLVVWGEQISPDPASATPVSPTNNDQTPTELPSDSPSLWNKFTDWLL